MFGYGFGSNILTATVLGPQFLVAGAVTAGICRTVTMPMTIKISFDTSQELLDKLVRLQNMCIRYIFGLRKFDHISEYRKQLNWLPIRLRRDMHVLSLLYDVLTNPTAPQYLRERFNFRAVRVVSVKHKLGSKYMLITKSAFSTVHVATIGSAWTIMFTTPAIYMELS